MASSKHRKNTDIMKLIQAQYKVNIISDIELHVQLHGPKGSLYEAGVFNIKVVLPENYPYKSPSVVFLTRVFHPNIEEQSGSICLDVLHQTWTPLYNLNNIFDTLLPQLLMYPNFDDPLNAAAATLYLNQAEAYKRRVIEYVKRFATPVTTKEIPKKNEMSSDDESSLSDMSDISDDNKGKGDGKQEIKHDEDENEKQDEEKNKQGNDNEKIVGEAVGKLGEKTGEETEEEAGREPGKEATEANENTEDEVEREDNDESVEEDGTISE